MTSQHLFQRYSSVMYLSLMRTTTLVPLSFPNVCMTGKLTTALLQMVDRGSVGWNYQRGQLRGTKSPCVRGSIGGFQICQ